MAMAEKSHLISPVLKQHTIIHYRCVVEQRNKTDYNYACHKDRLNSCSKDDLKSSSPAVNPPRLLLVSQWELLRVERSQY